MEGSQSRGAVDQFTLVTVRESADELLLVGYQHNALELAAEVLKFLDHDLAIGGIQATKAFVDNHCLYWPARAAGVLADRQ